MKKTMLQIMISGLMAMPLLAMADNNASQMCGNQPYQSLTQQCLTNSPDACSQIIQNNCLSLDATVDPTAPSITLTQITAAMMSQYAMQAGSGGDQATAPSQSSQPKQQQTALQQPVHSLLGKPIFENPAKNAMHNARQKALKSQLQKPAQKSNNYWF